MSVSLVERSGDAWLVSHGERNHGGLLDPSALGYGMNMDGTPNRDIVIVPCPVEGCGSVSYWPREALPDLSEVLPS